MYFSTLGVLHLIVGVAMGKKNQTGERLLCLSYLIILKQNLSKPRKVARFLIFLTIDF